MPQTDRHFSGWFRTVFWLCFSAIGSFTWAQANRIDFIRPDAPALAAYGRLGVGVTTAHFQNPQQWDIVNAKSGSAMPLYDRPLTVEIWYPGQIEAAAPHRAEYKIYFRDGKTHMNLYGKALRDAKPHPTSSPYPLVVVSHGYPGNRYLLSPITENLASKGYVVVSIDHTDSTYADQSTVASSLRNRSLDLTFVIDEMVKINRDANSPLKGLIDENRIALIGESMGGYGVINKLGGGYSDKATQFPDLPPDSLQPLLNSNPDFAYRRDPRIQAGVVFGPWGWSHGVWDDQGLQGIRTPILYIAGGVDEISGEAPDIRALYEGSIRTDRYLLISNRSDRRACVQIPMSQMALDPANCAEGANSIAIEFELLWDNVRMNNIAQHFITAFLGKYLENDNSKAAYIDAQGNVGNGNRSANAAGGPDDKYSPWSGISSRPVAGVRLDHLKAAAK